MRFIIFLVGLCIAGAINPEWVALDDLSGKAVFMLNLILYYAVVLDVVEAFKK